MIERDADRTRDSRSRSLFTRSPVTAIKRRVVTYRCVRWPRLEAKTIVAWLVSKALRVEQKDDNVVVVVVVVVVVR